jgi:hypothetical protein
MMRLAVVLALFQLIQLEAMGTALASAGCDAVNGGALNAKMLQGDTRPERTVPGFARGDRVTVDIFCSGPPCVFASLFPEAQLRRDSLLLEFTLRSGDGSQLITVSVREYRDGSGGRGWAKLSHEVTGSREDTTLTFSVSGPSYAQIDSTGSCIPAGK